MSQVLHQRRRSTVPPRGSRFLSFSAQGLSAAHENIQLRSYLSSANLFIEELDDDDKLTARVVQYPHITIAHVILPIARITWPRDPDSLNRGAVILLNSGSLTIDSRGPVALHNPGVSLIPPGSEPLSFQTTTRCELIYVSFPATFLGGDHTARVIDRDGNTEGNEHLIRPLYAYFASICTSNVARRDAWLPLQDLTEDGIRNLLNLIVDRGSPTRESLYESAMAHLRRTSHMTSTSVESLAAAMSVSPRTLQHSFQEHNTTVRTELRRARSAHAVFLRDQDPSLSLDQVAKMVGFGSRSALVRALREARQEQPRA